MLFSTTTDFLESKYGAQTAVKRLIDAGFVALDYSMFSMERGPFCDTYREDAKRLRQYAEDRGVIFNQGHAPFGRSMYEEYINEIVPKMPRCFEFASLLGIKCVVVHPTQKNGYYGNEEEVYDINMKLYSSLAPYAKDYGVKIGIENMWSRHPKTGRICDAVCADPKMLLKYYRDLSDPEAFTICLDLGHVALCGREPDVAIREIGGENLGALHVHDVDYVSDLHTLPGIGKINYDKVAKSLADVDYKGEITLESDFFYYGFDEPMWESVSRFMAKTAKSIADKVEKYKKER